MRNLNQNNQRVDAGRFAMVPRSDVPRSTFRTEHAHKTTLAGGNLVPIFVDEVLPGDTFKGRMTLFARMNTLLFPIMDHITAESFFFFCPARLVWNNWKRMMGEQDTPGASIAYTVPQCNSPASGWAVCSLQDYMGLPTVGQVTAGEVVAVNAMPLRAYALIWNEWFRDENIDTPITVATDNGPDASGAYAIQRRRKKHDYFTSALPWPLKGGNSVTMPLAGQAPVTGLAAISLASGAGAGGTRYETPQTPVTYAAGERLVWDPAVADGLVAKTVNNAGTYELAIYADLSQATGATIAALRLAFQTQRFLERDARGGTRYTELLRSHFGVMPEDARLQRPEYIGGGKSHVQTQAIPQTSATGLTGGSTPLGGLGATSTLTGQHSFRYDATEHGYIIGLLHIDAELTYQQGLHRMWTRQTRYDFYWPVFAHLSEQIIRNDEIFVTGVDATDAAAFGYQERWAEYRYRPSKITGLFRSTSAGTIDPWHCAQVFSGLPTLNSTFISSIPPFARNLAAGSAANNMQFLCDMLFQINCTRPMPMFSVPGGIDRF